MNQFIDYYVSTDEAKEISKLEEQQALNSIKIYIVPKATRRFTEWIVSKLGDASPHFTSLDVSRSLTKKWKQPGRIDYESKLFDGKVVIKFIIEKNASQFVIEKFGGPKMYIGYYDPIDEKYRLYDLFPKSMQIPQKESVNENIEPQGNISKEEEYRGLTFIKRGLVPMAVKTGNDRIRGWGHSELEQTDLDDVIKNLRKTNHVRDKGPGTVYGDYIEYSYSQPRKLPLRFWIKKEASNNPAAPLGTLVLVAGYEHPIRTENYNYIVSFNSEGRPNTFSEGVEQPILEGKYTTLSKMEEQQAVDYIKKVMMPPSVIAYNNKFEYALKKHQYIKPNSPPIRPATTEEMRRNLKKIERENSMDPLGYSFYRSIGYNGCPKMDYYITKEKNGLISIQFSEETLGESFENFIRP